LSKHSTLSARGNTQLGQEEQLQESCSSLSDDSLQVPIVSEIKSSESVSKFREKRENIRNQKCFLLSTELPKKLAATIKAIKGDEYIEGCKRPKQGSIKDFLQRHYTS
jgi:hypothetical protein